MSPPFAQLKTSIFEHMSGLARAYDAVNLGQGFPDFGWPEALLEEAARAVRDGWNQYPPMRGLPELRDAVAAHYRRVHGLILNSGNVVITSGATEALAASVLALVQPGDEVVLFEPLYDAYVPMVLRAGGIPRFVTLTPPDWRITKEGLDAAVNPRTKLIIFNNPHNPTARVFDDEEIGLVADACRASGAIALSDEVWEHLVFDGGRHRPLSSLPDMTSRTIKVGSAGKIFSLTGWKVGWIVAPTELAETVANAHQFVTFATAPSLQSAVAFGLANPLEAVESAREAFAESRDYLRRGLEHAGYAPLHAEGTYFLCVDLAASGVGVDDRTFCEKAVAEAGVAAIPISAFYEGSPVDSVIRLCFAKRRETLDAGIAGFVRARALFA
jgi:N-succinyldiaminopimelate aminotransferase